MVPSTPPGWNFILAIPSFPIGEMLDICHGGGSQERISRSEALMTSPYLFVRQLVFAMTKDMAVCSVEEAEENKIIRPPR